MSKGVVRFDWLEEAGITGWIEVVVSTDRTIPRREYLKPEDIVAYHLSVGPNQIQNHREPRGNEGESSMIIDSPHHKPLVLDGNRLFLVGDGEDEQPVSITFTHFYTQPVPAAHKRIEIVKRGFEDSANRNQIDVEVSDLYVGTDGERVTREHYTNPAVLGATLPSVKLAENGRRVRTYEPPTPAPPVDTRLDDAEKHLNIAIGIIQSIRVDG